jgi:4-hydroxy-tetrahydrodipicolinate synthase
MMNTKEFQGSWPALVTPMRKAEAGGLESIDFDRFQQLIQDCIDAGVTGLLFAGTTGQSATLSHEEHAEVVRKGSDFALKYANSQGKRVQLIAGAGSNATHEAVELSKRIVDTSPVDAVLHVTGYYNNPPQEGLIKHFVAIADAMESSEVPVILYNVPGRTNSNLEAETTIKLAQHPLIIGTKEASGDLEKVEQIVAAVDKDSFRVVSGEDHLVYEIMKRGGTGVITASGNKWPRQFQRLVELGLAERWDEAKALQEALLPCINAVFSAKNPIPLCWMFNSAIRLPLVSVEELSAEARDKTEKMIEQAMAITDFPHMED